MGFEDVGVVVAVRKSRRRGALAKVSGASEDVLAARNGGAEEVGGGEAVATRAGFCRGRRWGH